MSQPRILPGREPFRFDGGPVGVLMVHGLTGSPASMRPIGEWLAAQGLSVLGVRLPGHGTDVEDLRTRRWTEWVDEAAGGLDELRSACRTVVAFGQSVGAAVVLMVAASRPHDVDGLALSNPYVFDVRLVAAPIGRRILRDWKAVGGDVRKPGQEEQAYPRTPTAAIAELHSMLKILRSSLGSIRQPVMVFRSTVDHVAPRGNVRKLLARIGSEGVEVVECPNSYHVLTLDHDAPLVQERVLAFAQQLDAAKGEDAAPSARH